MVEAVDEGSQEWDVCELALEKEVSCKNLPDSIATAIPQLDLNPVSRARAFTYKSSSETGSMWTTAEEATNLANDPVAGPAIQGSSSKYNDALTKYRAGSIQFADLQKEYASIFPALLESVKDAISKDTTGKILPIQGDYDASHQSEYTAYLQTLIGLAQNLLNIPAYQCLLPPSSDYKNLLENGDFSQQTTGWSVSSGAGTMKVNPPGTYDKTSPVENKNSLSFTGIPTKPGYVSVSQTIPTTPGHTYLVSGYVIGTPPDSPDHPYTGGISLDQARFYTSSTTEKVMHFPQNSNELDEKDWHRRYFWVEASGTSMTINLSGAKDTVFKSIGIYDVPPDKAFEIADQVCPPVTTTGAPEVGHYPQVEKKLSYGDNLLDGAISIQKNIDQSALNNAGHPYWFFDSHNQANKQIKITNATNGAHGLYMPTNASVTSNAPVQCPSGAYNYSMEVYVPSDSEGKVNVQISGTSLTDNASLPKTSKDFDNLNKGEVNTIQFPVDESIFQNLPKGTFFRPTVAITNLGDNVTIFSTQLDSQDNSLYDQINEINPYCQRNPWSQPTTYDFTTGPVSRDWAMSLTGNTMFSPGAPATDYTTQTKQGIQLASHRDNSSSPKFSNGGIQSTQMLPSGENFSMSMDFILSSQDPSYKPTVALWTYGESQRGPDSPLYHTNAPGAGVITEFDCEMGSDSGDNSPPPEGFTYARDGSYIGYAEGGHSEYIDMDSKGLPDWKKVPDFWDGKTHTLSMEGNYNPNGHMIITRKLDGKIFSTQDVGPGPFSPTYIKIAFENPDNWNSRGRGNGSAIMTIPKITVHTSPPENLSSGVTIPTIPASEMDYIWFTPGGGGSPSYTPFPSSSPPPSYHNPTSVQDLESELGQWETQDPVVKSFADTVLPLVQKFSSAGSGLPAIEAWVYTVVTNITDNSSLATAYAALTSEEKDDFGTLSGYSNFTAQASKHVFDKPTIVAIAKPFFDGSFGLQNSNDKDLMSDFYQNLNSGQDPKTAAQNAYAKVLSSTVSKPMNALVQGLSSYTPSFTPHNPTSVQDLENQLTEIGVSSSDKNLKAFTAAVLKEVTTLAGKELSILSIEAWSYASIVGQLTADSEYAIGFQNLTPSEQRSLKTITGIDQFESDLSSHSFNKDQITAIAKVFSDGTIPLKSPNDTKYMSAFYSNLHSGQAPQTAAQNAYTTVARSSVSQALQTFISGLTG